METMRLVLVKLEQQTRVEVEAEEEHQVVLEELALLLLDGPHQILEPVLSQELEILLLQTGQIVSLLS